MQYNFDDYKQKLQTKAESGNYKPLKECLNMITLDEIKRITKIGGYDYRSKWKKADYIESLSQQIPNKLKESLNDMFLRDFYNLISAIDMNGAQVDKVEFIRAGYLFGFYFLTPDKKSHNEKNILFFPSELLNIFADWYDVAKIDELTKRSTMDIFVKGLAEIYGVFPIEILKKLWKMYNNNQDYDEDVFQSLFIDKLSSYVKIDQYIMIDLLAEEDQYQRILNLSQDKDYYIPKFSEIMNFAELFPYGDLPEFIALKEYFLSKSLDELEVDNLMNELECSCAEDASPKDLIQVINTNQINFEDQKDVETMFGLLMNFSNNTRKWILKGHKPSELKHIDVFEEQNNSSIKKGKKIYPNDPCPCGSGKKYKKCCLHLKVV